MKKIITPIFYIASLFYFLMLTGIIFSATETQTIENQLNQQIRQNQAQERERPASTTQTPEITPPATNADPTSDWTETFAITFGFEMALGNSRAISGTYSIRYTSAYKELFDITASIDGSYGESFDTGTNAMKKDRSEHKLSIVLDRWFLEKLLAVTYNTELTTNQFSNIYIRWANGLGLKFKPISRWWIDTSISISPTVEYVKTYDLLTRKIEWTIAYAFEYNFNFNEAQTVSLNNSLTFTPKFTKYKDYRLNITSNFTVKFLKYYSISINFSYDYVSMPPNEYTAVKKSDYRVSTSIGFSI